MASERVVTPVIQVRLEQMWEENQNQMRADLTHVKSNNNHSSFKSVQPSKSNQQSNQPFDTILSDRPQNYHSKPFYKPETQINMKESIIEP